MNKYLEKIAEQTKEAGVMSTLGGFASSIAKRATPAINLVKQDASQLPGQLRGVKTAFRAGQGNVFKRPGMTQSLNALGHNRAVRVGAGVVAGGVMARALTPHDKQAELSEENKAVLRTVGETAAVGIPVHMAGEVLGNYLGRKYHVGGIAQSAMGHLMGVAGDVVAVKHSLHDKIPEAGPIN